MFHVKLFEEWPSSMSFIALWIDDELQEFGAPGLTLLVRRTGDASSAKSGRGDHLRCARFGSWRREMSFGLPRRGWRRINELETRWIRP